MTVVAHPEKNEIESRGTFVAGHQIANLGFHLGRRDLWNIGGCIEWVNPFLWDRRSVKEGPKGDAGIAIVAV